MMNQIPSSALTTANNGNWTTSTTLSHNGVAGSATPGSFTLDTVAPTAPAAQLAAAAETAADQSHVLSSSPDDPQLERWLQRQAAAEGERLDQLRQRFWEGARFQRHDRVLLVEAHSLLWALDPLEAVPEGDVVITLLSRNPVRITGDQARWIPRQNLMVIDRGTGPQSIERTNQERVQRVSAETEVTLSEAVTNVQARLRLLFFEGAVEAFQIVIPAFGILEGPFQIASLEYRGDHAGEVTFDMSLESGGALAFAAV